MKKYGMIFASVIFTLVILFVPNKKVKAEELESKTYNYDNSTSVIANYEKFSTALEEARLYLEQYKEDYYYFIYFDSMKIYVDLVEKKSSIVSYLNLSSSSITYSLSSNGIKVNKISLSATDLSGFETSFTTFKTNLENNNFTYDILNGSHSYAYLSSGAVSSAFIRMYYTNFDNFILSEDSVYNLNLNNDLIIKPGEEIPTYYEFTNNSFDEVISTGTYSKVEFEFTLPKSTSICTKGEYVDGVLTEVEYVCPILDLNYNIYSSDNEGNMSIMPFTIPYIYKRYLVDSDNMSITKVDTIPLGDNMYNQYQGNYSVENDYVVEKIKLVIDFTGYEFSYVNVQFDSNTTFEVTYYEREVEQEYIGSVDLTGKAGVMFIPKQITDDMILNFSFYQNSYSAQLRDTYKSEFNILKYYSIGYCDYRDYTDDIPYICNNGTSYNISVEFKKGNLEQSLFIVNRDYPKDNKSVVYYDTRYFDYVVYNTLADNPTFIHPITGESNVSVSLIDFDSSMTEQQSFFDSIMLALNHFKGIIIEIFDNISYFFDNLNFELKYFFIVVFSLIIFIFLTRFLL